VFLQVPTVDTVRNKYVVSSLVRVFTHTLVVGNVGVGKTMAVQSLLESIPADRYLDLVTAVPHTVSSLLCVSIPSC
jgi:dynein heavy chain